MAINSSYEVVGLDGTVILKTVDIKEARKADKIVAASQSILDIIKEGLPEGHEIPESHLISIAQHIIEKKQEVGDLLKSFREGKKKDDAPASGEGSSGGEGNDPANGGNKGEGEDDGDKQPGGEKEPGSAGDE